MRDRKLYPQCLCFRLYPEILIKSDKILIKSDKRNNFCVLSKSSFSLWHYINDKIEAGKRFFKVACVVKITLIFYGLILL